MLLAPALFSTDVFSYQFYGRIGQVYHANPYLAGPFALHLDPQPQLFDQAIHNSQAQPASSRVRFPACLATFEGLEDGILFLLRNPRTCVSNTEN